MFKPERIYGLNSVYGCFQYNSKRFYNLLQVDKEYIDWFYISLYKKKINEYVVVNVLCTFENIVSVMQYNLDPGISDLQIKHFTDGFKNKFLLIILSLRLKCDILYIILYQGVCISKGEKIVLSSLAQPV